MRPPTASPSLRSDAAFTLVELLVVLAVIGILAAMLLPTLAGGKERARRAHCLNNERQFLLAAHLYAADNQQYLPRPETDNSNQKDTHTPVVSSRTKTNLLQYAGSLKSLDCPSLDRWMDRKSGWRNHDAYGIAIGYHYLGGHSGTPWIAPDHITNTWVSPQKITDDPTAVLVADLNIYCASYGRMLAPHTSGGPALRESKSFYDLPLASQKSPASIGAQGGNVGLLDASASWKAMAHMRHYRASQVWGDEGAFGVW